MAECLFGTPPSQQVDEPGLVSHTMLIMGCGRGPVNIWLSRLSTKAEAGNRAFTHAYLISIKSQVAAVHGEFRIYSQVSPSPISKLRTLSMTP
jgi:hypothetical protein